MRPAPISAFLLTAVLFGAGCASSSPPPPPPAEPAPEVSIPERPQVPWADVEAVGQHCGHALAVTQSVRAELRAVPASRRAEATVLSPYNRMMTALYDAMGHMELVANTHPDPALRARAEACERELKGVANNVSLDRDLYEAVEGVAAEGIDAGAVRFREKLLLELRLAGVDKDEATRARLEALHEEMVAVGQEFSRNIRDDVRTVSVAPAELAGLPEDFLKAHPPGPDGKVTLNTNYPDFFPVLTYAKSEAVRRELAKAFLSRAHPANEAVLKRLLTLRHEYAGLLGFESWADYKVQDKMAKTPATVRDFTAEVAKVARPRMERDLKQLLASKRKRDPKATVVYEWDRFFHVQEVQKAKYGFDAAAARAYFSYPAILDGILELYADLFDLSFERVDVPVWHESVVAYEMKADGAPVGRFYLDMHPRKDKYQHAAMFPMTVGLAGGQRAEAALVCNFPNPAEGTALMEHSQVVTFFHEFGHLVHHMLAQRSSWANQSGINTEWDFVEAPSQLLEEWAWSPRVLERFAKHQETGAPIPAELVKKMRAASEFGKGVHVMRQLHLQALSFELHDRDPAELDLDPFTREIAKRYSPFPHAEGTHQYASFGHLEGYSSMYYTYQWSLSLAKDIFTRFEQAGILDKTTAVAYRKAILEAGGSKDASRLVEDFLGRAHGLEAYRRWLERE